jgi:hypothetical protein
MADTATFRIHYEHLVRDPHETLAGLLEFLDVKRDKRVITAMTDEVWDADHGPGWGDQKLALTTKIAARSVGRGRGVPASLIDPRRRAVLNSLLQDLGYAAVTEDWNLSSRVDPAADVSLQSPHDNALAVSRLMRELVQPRLDAQPAGAAPPLDIVITYGADLRQRWTVEPSLKTIVRAAEDAGAADADDAGSQHARVTMRAEVMLGLLLRGLSLDSALKARMIRISGDSGPGSGPAITRLLASLVAEGG